MKRVTYRRQGIINTILGARNNDILAGDITSELIFNGLDKDLKVFSLERNNSFAIYFRDKRIIEHRSDFLRESNQSKFSNEYFSTFGNDMIYYKGYEPAKYFAELVKSYSEEVHKYGDNLVYVNGRLILRIVFGADLTSWVRRCIEKRKVYIRNWIGFEYEEGTDQVFALCLFLYELNGYESG